MVPEWIYEFSETTQLTLTYLTCKGRLANITSRKGKKFSKLIHFEQSNHHLVSQLIAQMLGD